MSNKYLAELEKLNKELSLMTDEEILSLFDGVDEKTLFEEAKDYAVLENYIMSSDVPKDLKK